MSDLAYRLTDYDAEKSVLAACMSDEQACTAVLDKLTEDDFAMPLHREAFTLIKKVSNAGYKPTYAEVLREAYKAGSFQHRNDADELSDLAGQWVDTGNIKYWLKAVSDKRKLRELERSLRKYQAVIAGSEQYEVESLLEQVSTEIVNISIANQTDTVDTPQDIAKAGADNYAERVQAYAENKGVRMLEGVTSGFPSLDRKTLGYKPGDLIIYGAQTGHGKSDLALNTAMACAIAHRQPCFYVNTEMSRQQINFRLASMLSGVDHYKILTGSTSAEEQQAVLGAFAAIDDSALYHYAAPNLTLDKLQSVGRLAKMRYGCRLFILDYIGRMDTVQKDRSEWQVLEATAKTLKLMAQTLGFAVICLVQISSDGSMQGSKRMKNECDLMARFVPLTDEQMQSKNHTHELIIDKSRDSETGTIPILYKKHIHQMREYYPAYGGRNL